MLYTPRKTVVLLRCVLNQEFEVDSQINDEMRVSDCGTEHLKGYLQLGKIDRFEKRWKKRKSSNGWSEYDECNVV